MAETRDILFYGNVISEALAAAYRQHLAPLRRERVRFLPALPKATMISTASEFLSRTDALVVEVCDWDAERFQTPARSGPSVLTFPTCDGRFLWPFSDAPHPKNGATSYLPDGPYPEQLGDSFLNNLIRQGVGPEAAHELYLELDIARAGRLEELYEGFITRQKRRDEVAGFGVTELITSSLRSQSVFVTPGQPDLRVFGAIARHVYVGLGHHADRVDQALAALRYAPFALNALPLHPGVIEHFEIKWANADTRYPHLCEGRFTFAEYVRRYVSYDWNRELAEGIHLCDADPKRALALLEFGLSRSTMAVLGFVGQARLLRGKSLLSEARQAIDKALHVDPGEAEAHVERSAILLAEQRLDEAEAAAHSALALWPGCATGFAALANVSAARGDLSAALAHQQQAVEQAPGDARAWLALANLALRASKLDQAERALHEATWLEPATLPVRALQADVLIRQGRHNEAIAILREVTAAPGAAAAWYMLLGQALLSTGDVAEAECFLRRAAEIDPGTDRVHGLLAAALHRLGRRDDVMAILQAQIAGQTSDAYIHYLFGHIIAQDGNLIDAEAALRKAAALRPDVDGYQGRLAEVLNRQGRREEALTILRDLVAGGTLDADIHYLLGTTLGQAGHLAEAEQALCQSITLRPDIDGYKAALADVLNRCGRRDEAVAMLRVLVAKTTADSNVHARLGNLLAEGGDLIGAESAFRAASELDPRADSFQASLADVLRRQGKRSEALTIFRGLSDKSTDYSHAYAGLGNTLSEDGDLAGAEAAFRKAVALDPQADSFHASLAGVLRRQGKRADALAILQELSRKSTSYPHAYAGLGNTLSEDGDLAGAEAAFRKAIDLHPGGELFHASLADVLRRQGKRAEALAVLNDLSVKSSKNSTIYAGLGAMLAEDGDLAGAEAAFRTACDLSPSVGHFRFSLADICDRQGNHAAAHAILQDLVSNATGDARIYARLGAVAMSMGNLAEAADAFRAAVELDASVAAFHVSLSEVLHRLNRHDEALKVSRAAVARLPADAALVASLTALTADAPDVENSDANQACPGMRDRQPSGDLESVSPSAPEPGQWQATPAGLVRNSEPVEPRQAKVAKGQWVLLRRAIEAGLGMHT
jgi:tetratricopeptide (TPR) repeat protein